eukprot:TRINITY_DN5456_c0_g1_i1.p1 TRINITY_DN5456_c0_g1~~TRINITY_DN5456_c0_g1_i1.p1  ORF type:complete len:128 (+),score=6.71 TRINITY_DN5456_c0_g1_i1:1413-1796(+)
MNGSDDNNQSYTAEPDVTIFDLRHTISTIPTGTVTNSVDSVSGISISKNDVRTSGDGTTVTPTVVLIPDPVSTVVDVTDTEDTTQDGIIKVRRQTCEARCNQSRQRNVNRRQVSLYSAYSHRGHHHR